MGLRRLLGLKSKSKLPATSAQSSRDLTFTSPDPFESDAQFAAVKQHLAQSAARDPERFRAVMREASFMGAKHYIGENFAGAALIDMGSFPGELEGVEGVGSDDTKMLLACSPDNPKDFQAVTLVVHQSVDGAMPVAGQALDSPAWAKVEAALANFLKEWAGQGMTDGFLCFVFMGVDMSVNRFDREKGLVDVPDAKFETKKVEPW